MKKILLILGVMFLLVGCKKNTTKEEYIPLLEDNGIEYYVASPSGIVYYKATDSNAMIVWHDSQGKTRNIYEVENVREDK